ncbi:MAG: hypothetical protein H0T73_20440 [Ardenticatenales bacterium]|nr:hypothetical protein [Ardenticatenales bacterium]
MLKKLFSFGKKEAKAAPVPPTPSVPKWSEPTIPFLDYYALHFHEMELDAAERAVREHYLVQGEAGTPGALLAKQGAWVTAYFPEKTVRGLGFNRQASFIAREQGTWVIGYRIYQGEGLDVHYFRSNEHVEQLAFSTEGIEFEPTDPELFAALGDGSLVLPRSATQHPLDFHFALLAAIGIADAALSWEEALARHEAAALGDSRLLLFA